MRNQNRTRLTTAGILWVATCTTLNLGAMTAFSQSAYAATVNFSIKTQPSPLDKKPGQWAQFSIATSGPGPFSLQWFKDGSAIKGATSSWYAIRSVSETDAGKYSVKVSNSSGQLWSQAATLTITGATDTTQPPNETINKIQITDQPDGLDKKIGQWAQFNVVASSTDSLSYQWLKDGLPIASATKNWFAIRSVQLEDAGRYAVKITNQSGQIVSESALLSIEGANSTPPAEQPKAITITTQPTTLFKSTGQWAQFNVAASGDGTLEYQWLKNGVAIPEATRNWFAIRTVSEKDHGLYSVKISNGATSILSNKAALNIEGLATLDPSKGDDVASSEPTPVTPDIAISLNPASQSIYVAQSVTLNVSATGSGSLKYQWKKDGISIPGANLHYYTIAQASRTDTGSYSVTISNLTGSVVSDTASIDVSVDRNANLSWTAPQKRIDGNPLKPSEISMYRIYHFSADGSVETYYETSAAEYSLQLSSLASGEHNFAITAIDTFGLESELSPIVAKTILN